MLLKAVPNYKFLKVILPKKGVFYGGPDIPSIRSILAQPGYYGRQYIRVSRSGMLSTLPVGFQHFKLPLFGI